MKHSLFYWWLAPADVSSTLKAAYISSLVDPRHKRLRFTTDEDKRAVQAKVCDLLLSSSEGLEEIVAVESDENVLLARNMETTDND